MGLAVTRRTVVNLIGKSLLFGLCVTGIREAYKCERTPDPSAIRGGMPTSGHLRFLTGDKATARFASHLYITNEDKIRLSQDGSAIEITWNRENGFVFTGTGNFHGTFYSPPDFQRKSHDPQAKSEAIEWLDKGLKALRSDPNGSSAKALSATRDFLDAQPD